MGSEMCIRDSENTSRVNEGKQNWDEIQWTSNKFGHLAHDDEQQQEAAALLLQQQHHYSNTQSSSSGSSSTLYAYETDFYIAQTTPQPSSYIYLHWQQNTWRQQKKSEIGTHTKKRAIRDSNR